MSKRFRRAAERCIGPTNLTSCTLHKTTVHSVPCSECEGYRVPDGYVPIERKVRKLNHSTEEPPPIKGWVKKGLIKVPVYYDE